MKSADLSLSVKCTLCETLRRLRPLSTPRALPPLNQTPDPRPPEPARAQPDAVPAIERRPHVEVERHVPRARARAGLASVEVDDVARARPAAVDDPVVPVERRCVPTDSGAESVQGRTQSKRQRKLADPQNTLHRALTDLSPGRPLKLTSRTPPQRSPPAPSSQPRMCAHARSLTALWIGTTTGMSPARGARCLRASARKNCACEG